MKRTLLLLISLSTPCWADGLGPGLIGEVGGLLAAWLLSPLVGIVISEFGGMRAKGCSTMVAAYAIGIVASTACLYTMFQFKSSPYELNYLVGALAGAGATLWVIYRSRQVGSGDSQS